MARTLQLLRVFPGLAESCRAGFTIYIKAPDLSVLFKRHSKVFQSRRETLRTFACHVISFDPFGP